MTDPGFPSNDERGAPLATSRPWLSVLGCLGGGTFAIGAALLAIVVAVVAFVVFDGFSGSGARPVIFSALGKLCEAPALRVATREIAVRVEASVPTEATIRPWLVPYGPGWRVELGLTKVELLVPQNVVQYIVPLDAFKSDIRAEHTGDGWIVTLPPPRVDETLVEVQSDWTRVAREVDRDWVDHLVGDDAAEKLAIGTIRAAVVREASSDVAMFEVREKARATVAEMIRALLPEHSRARRLEIRWSDDPETD